MESRRPPPSARSCDGALWLLAIWTLLSHLVVFLGGGLRSLVQAAGVVVALALAAAIFGRRHRRSPSPDLTPSPAATSTPSGPKLRVLAIVLAVATTAGYVLGLGFETLWWTGMATLVLALVSEGAPTGGAAPAPVDTRTSETTVWTLALVAGLIPLVAHVYSPDDTYYVNVAVAAADAPDAPLLQHDTLHGIDGLPIMYSAYRLNSFELLGAAIAYLTPLSALQASHWVLAGLFGLLMVLAYARLMKTLLPHTWLAGLVVCVLVLVFVTDKPRFVSGFALTRSHQGKAAFLSFVAPLLVVHGLRFAAAPSLGRGALLAAAQIAGVGLTSTAIWLGPSIAALSLASGVSYSRSGLRRLGLGLATSLYVVILGLALRGVSSQEIQSEASLMEQFAMGGRELCLDAWLKVLGTGPVSALALLAFLGAWSVCRHGVARRASILLPLGTLLFYNPYVAPTLALGITGPPTYWRVLWITPWAALLAIVLLAPWIRRPRRWPASWSAAVAAAVVAAFLLWAPQRELLSEESRVRWELLGFKLPAKALDAARAITEEAPAGSFVLAPSPVSGCVPMLHGHPFPLVNRLHYLRIQQTRLDAKDVRLRERVFHYISGKERSERGALDLERALSRYELSVVCAARSLEWIDETRRALTDAGFALGRRVHHYEIWTRSRDGDAVDTSSAQPLR